MTDEPSRSDLHRRDFLKLAGLAGMTLGATVFVPGVLTSAAQTKPTGGQGQERQITQYFPWIGP